MVSGVSEVNNKKGLNYSDFRAVDSSLSNDGSIFTKAFGNSFNTNENEEQNAEMLYQKLEETKDEQGIITGVWNNFKEMVNIGASGEKCENIIEDYKAGKVTFEEAQSAIENYDAKQESSLNLFANIVTSCISLAAAAAVVSTGGLAAPVITGILAGAGAKAVFKGLDRATNDVKGDTIDAEEIGKDALTGALTGGIAVATAGTGADTFKNGVKIGGKTFEGAKACALKSAKTGIITGGISGASNYAIDCAFDEDKEFNTKDFAVNTITSTAAGGTVGVLMGGLNGILRANDILHASDTNVIANATSSAGYKITNDRIRAVFS